MQVGIDQEEFAAIVKQYRKDFGVDLPDDYQPITRSVTRRPGVSPSGILISVVIVALVAMATWSIDSPVFWVAWTVFWSIVWVVLKKVWQ